MVNKAWRFIVDALKNHYLSNGANQQRIQLVEFGGKKILGWPGELNLVSERVRCIWPNYSVSHGASISHPEVNVLLMRCQREIKRRMQTVALIVAEVLFHVKIRQYRFDKITQACWMSSIKNAHYRISG